MKHNALRIFGMSVAVLLAGAASAVRADTLIGSAVTGSLKFSVNQTNYFDYNNGQVPSGFLNSSPNTTTVVIDSPAVEFGYGDPGVQITADFDGTNLLLTERFSVPGNYTSQHFTFTDSAFAAGTLTKLTDTFPGNGVFSQLDGDTLVLVTGGFLADATDYSASFSLFATPTSVPLPQSVWGGGALLAGLFAISALRRRPQAANA